MLYFKKLAIIALVMLTAIRCTQNTKKLDPLQEKLNELDTLVLNTKESTFNLKRYREFKHKKEQFKLGKLNINLGISNLSTAVDVDYAIDSGYLMYNKKIFIVKCFLNTQQIITPVIATDSTLKPETPNYLKGKTIALVYKGNFYPKEQKPSASFFIQLNDTPALVRDAKIKVKQKNKRIYNISTHYYLNGIEWSLFDEENRSEIVKDSIIGNIQLVF